MRNEFDKQAFIKILEQIGPTCIELNIDFFIIGSTAQNLWLEENNKITTGTKDFDFAVYVPTAADYEELKLKLQKDLKYSKIRDNAFCLISPEGIEIDLLPFGEIVQDEKVMIAGHGLTTIKLEGIEEVYSHGTNIFILNETSYKSCSISGIVILKLIAFDDRPHHRQKDVMDITEIFRYYPDLEMEHIWSQHSDLYDLNKEHEEVAVMVLGREMNKILRQNQKLRKRVLNILDKTINMENSFIELMIQDPETDLVDHKRKIFQNLKEGFISEF